MKFHTGVYTKKKFNEKRENPFGNFLETLIKDVIYDNQQNEKKFEKTEQLKKLYINSQKQLAERQIYLQIQNT